MLPRVAGLLVLLVLGLTFSSCLWISHVSCHGGREGVCSIDAYGLMVTRSHVDLPVREIVLVNADERTSRRSGSSATMRIFTRTMGIVDLAGAQRLGGAVSAERAADVSAALRPFQPDGSATPADVDVWLWPPLSFIVIILIFCAPTWWMFVRLLLTPLRPLHDG